MALIEGETVVKGVDGKVLLRLTAAQFIGGLALLSFAVGLLVGVSI